MLRFNRVQIRALREYLYHSYVHDAVIEATDYDRKEKKLTIKAFNPIWNSRMHFTFEKVKVILNISGNEPGSSETIVSLTAEGDYSYLQNYINGYSDGQPDYVYILFQMLSGDELHIVSQNVIIDDVK